MPQLTPEQILQVSGLVAQYIAAQRDKLFPQAAPLTAAQRAAMAGFFQSQALDAARLLVLHGIRVEDPPFYPMLAGMGFSDVPAGLLPVGRHHVRRCARVAHAVHGRAPLP